MAEEAGMVVVVVVDSENADRVLMTLVFGSGTNKGRAYPEAGSGCVWVSSFGIFAAEG